MVDALVSLAYVQYEYNILFCISSLFVDVGYMTLRKLQTFTEVIAEVFANVIGDHLNWDQIAVICPFFLFPSAHLADNGYQVVLNEEFLVESLTVKGFPLTILFQYARSSSYCYYCIGSWYQAK